MISYSRHEMQTFELDQTLTAA